MPSHVRGSAELMRIGQLAELIGLSQRLEIAEGFAASLATRLPGRGERAASGNGDGGAAVVE